MGDIMEGELEQTYQVRLENSELHIDELVIDDVEVVNYFAGMEPETVPGAFENALKLGVITLKTTGMAAKTMYVEQCFAEMSEAFNGKIEGTFGEEGDIQKVITQYFGKDGELVKTMGEFLGDRGQFSTLLEKQFGPDGKVVKELFDPFKEGTPLFKLRAHLEHQLQTQINDLKTKLDLEKQKAEDRAKSTQKGKDFEELLEERLAGIAKVFGDNVENTAKIKGIVKDCLEGDFVVSVAGHSNLKIVYEAKDRETLNIPGMSAEVKEAMENRACCYGVLVSKYVETVPKSVGYFNEISNNVLVVALGTKEKDDMRDEILNIAYRWARTKALVSSAVASEKIDSTVIQKNITEAKTVLKTISKIKTHCDTTKKEVEEIETGILALKKALDAHLDAIFHELQKGNGASK